jgi:hypothetical protein
MCVMLAGVKRVRALKAAQQGRGGHSPQRKKGHRQPAGAAAAAAAAAAARTVSHPSVLAAQLTAVTSLVVSMHVLSFSQLFHWMM